MSSLTFLTNDSTRELFMSIVEMDARLKLTLSNCAFADQRNRSVVATVVEKEKKQKEVCSKLSRTFDLYNSRLESLVEEGCIGTDCEEPIVFEELDVTFLPDAAYAVLPSVKLMLAISAVNVARNEAEELLVQLNQGTRDAWEAYHEGCAETWDSYIKCEEEACALATSVREFDSFLWKKFSNSFQWLKLESGICKYYGRYQYSSQTYNPCRNGTYCKCAHMKSYPHQLRLKLRRNSPTKHDV